ncbi:MAG: phosphopantothenoylcysteine decarboxylase [Elusimicrobia bacterium]|nr:phosphopantothenoylcysteine decarboxylase [Candidatus Liberimonas magnetica]
MVNFLITSGATREYIDPVRFLSNASSGKMGCELAEAAKKLGHKVVLISGPSSFVPAGNIKSIPVTSASEMLEEVKKNISGSDIFICAAAVSDYRPQREKKDKIKKTKNGLVLKLVKTPDILKTISFKNRGKVMVGFCLESKNLVNQAIKKLKDKKLDLIVANPVKAIASDKSDVVIISGTPPAGAGGSFDNVTSRRSGIRQDKYKSSPVPPTRWTMVQKTVLRNKSKKEIAERIINEAARIFKNIKAC